MPLWGMSQLSGMISVHTYTYAHTHTLPLAPNILHCPRHGWGQVALDSHKGCPTWGAWPCPSLLNSALLECIPGIKAELRMAHQEGVDQV